MFAYPVYLFVYGTLMNQVDSVVADYLRRNSTFLGVGKMKGLLYDLGHYPGAIEQATSQNIVLGNVFELHNPETTFTILDDYEGIGIAYPPPHEYERRLAKVMVKNQILDCWAYLYNLPIARLPLISSGDYLSYIQSNERHQSFIQSLNLGDRAVDKKL